MKKICLQCKKEFSKAYTSSKAYFALQRFCGQKCFGDSRKGISHITSQETKEKMGFANKDNKTGIENGKQTRFIKGTPSARKGKLFPQLAGERCHFWKGGLPKCIDCDKQLGSY